jgi:hypothetical protein
MSTVSSISQRVAEHYQNIARATDSDTPWLLQHVRRSSTVKLAFDLIEDYAYENGDLVRPQGRIGKSVEAHIFDCLVAAMDHLDEDAGSVDIPKALRHVERAISIDGEDLPISTVLASALHRMLAREIEFIENRKEGAAA